MANFFSLYDGNLTDSSVYGYSLTGAEVMSNTTAVFLSTADAYGPLFTGDGSTISAIAVHLSSRQTNNTTDSLVLKLSAAGSGVVRTEYYPISTFTSYDGSYNSVANYPLNWQILKLGTGYTLPKLSSARISLAATTNNTISLMCSATNNNVDKAVIASSTLLYGPLTSTGTSLSSASPFGAGIDGSIKFNGTSDYIKLPNNSINFGTGDFVVECWYYPTGSKLLPVCLEVGDHSTSTGAAFVFQNQSVYSPAVYSAGQFAPTNTASIVANQWNHIVWQRSAGYLKIFVNGLGSSTVSAFSNNINGTNASVGYAAGWNGGANYYANGHIAYFLVHKNLYTSNFTPPSANLATPVSYVSLSSSILFINSSSYSVSSYGYQPSLDDIHIGSSIKLSATEVRSITANTISFKNLYIHNKSTLTFPLTSSRTLILSGFAGLQITSDGTVNIGTSSQNIPLSTTHTLTLSNTQIDIHNGGNFNVYGYPKLATTYLSSNTLSSSRTFTTTNSVSTTWLSGDTLVFTPNSSYKSGFDTLTLSSFIQDNTFTTTSSSVYTHLGLSSLPYTPTIFNLTRNIIIQGLNSTAKCTIRAVDAARVNINNSSLNNILSSGISIGTNTLGYIILSSNVLSGDNITNSKLINLISNKQSNSYILDNIIYKQNTVLLSAINFTNFNFNNNIILSCGGNSGLTMSNVSGIVAMSGNLVIGSQNYGSYLLNNTITGTYGALGYNSLLQGTLLTGINTGTIVGGGIYSSKEGIYVDASTYNLSSTTFKNIIASNNTSVGFKVSGNSVSATSAYLSPITLNINGLTANNNSDAGIEAYNIVGNISGVIANNNYLNGIKTSIGNGPTIFDGLTSIYAQPPTLSAAYTTTGTQTISANAPYVGFDALRHIRDTNNITISPTLPIGSGDFTIEFWVYQTTDVNSGYLIGQGSSQSGGWWMGNTGLRVYNGTTAVTISNPSGVSTLANNIWYHVAAVRKNNSINVFVNGVSGVAVSNSYNLNSIAPIRTGYNIDNTIMKTDGYISNFRIVTSALYTTNFTPTSSSKLFPVANTILLINNFNGYYTYLTTPSYFSANLINILSGYNYSQTVIKNALLSATFVDAVPLSASVAITIDSTRFSQFSIDNSSIYASTPLQTNASRNLLEGSYLFNNTYMGTTPLINGLVNYQPDCSKTLGFAFMNYNKIANNNFTYNPAGSINYDSVLYDPSSAYNDRVSERLIPTSNTKKLKSGSKFIGMDSGTVAVVSAAVLVSSNYNGNAPRLMVKRNPAIGVYDDTVLTTYNLALSSGVFNPLIVNSPGITDNGVLEFYIDCDGTAGYINVDSWGAI